MSHELTMNAQGVYEMAFVGQTPWHGLGQRVTEGASIETWAKQAGMLWTAERSVAQYNTPDGMRNADEKHVIWRSDNQLPLGVVGDGYQAVQPIEVLEFFRDLTEAGDWHIHTAGTLQGGRKLWALAHNATQGDAAPGDKVRGNLLLATSLDGSMRTVAAMTAIRVVCANTMKLALEGIKKGKRADSVSISHRSIFDADEVKRQLGLARGAFDSFMTQARTMANTPIGRDEAREVLRAIFGQPVIKSANQNHPDFARFMKALSTGAPVREQRSVPKVLELFNGSGMGATAFGSAGTRWGLFNAITEHIDHGLGRTADSRLMGAWFGLGHELKTQALAALAPTELATM